MFTDQESHVCLNEALHLISLGMLKVASSEDPAFGRHLDEPGMNPGGPDSCPSALLLTSKLVSLLILMISPLLKLQLIHSLFSKNQLISGGEWRWLAMELVNQVLAMSFNIRYRISLSAYGELYFLLFQNLIIIALAIWSFYSHQSITATGSKGAAGDMCSVYRWSAVIWTTVIWLVVVTCLNFLLDPRYLTDSDVQSLLVYLGTPLTALSLIPLIQNYINVYSSSNNSIQNLLVPVSMLWIGQVMGMARLFTTYVEVSSRLAVIMNAMIGPVLNLVLIILHYMITYRIKSRKQQEDQKEK